VTSPGSVAGVVISSDVTDAWLTRFVPSATAGATSTGTVIVAVWPTAS